MQRDIKGYTRRGAVGAPECGQQQRAARGESGSGSSLLQLLGRSGPASVPPSQQARRERDGPAADTDRCIAHQAANCSLHGTTVAQQHGRAVDGVPSWLQQPCAANNTRTPCTSGGGNNGQSGGQAVVLPWKSTRVAARCAAPPSSPPQGMAASGHGACGSGAQAHPGATRLTGIAHVLRALPLHRTQPSHNQQQPQGQTHKEPGRQRAWEPIPGHSDSLHSVAGPAGSAQQPHQPPRSDAPHADPGHDEPALPQAAHPPPRTAPRWLPADSAAPDCDEGGPLMVLGDSSKRAAARRAGLDGERLRQLRAVRARRGEGDTASRRFNHWEDGGCTWDYDTLGIDGADQCDMRWEGVGCTAVGPRM